MSIDDLKNEIKNWKLTRYKAINLAIGLFALLTYEFIARPYYRPSFGEAVTGKMR